MWRHRLRAVYNMYGFGGKHSIARSDYQQSTGLFRDSAMGKLRSAGRNVPSAFVSVASAASAASIAAADDAAVAPAAAVVVVLAVDVLPLAALAVAPPGYSRSDAPMTRFTGTAATGASSAAAAASAAVGPGYSRSDAPITRFSAGATTGAATGTGGGETHMRTSIQDNK